METMISNIMFGLYSVFIGLEAGFLFYNFFSYNDAAKRNLFYITIAIISGIGFVLSVYSLFFGYGIDRATMFLVGSILMYLAKYIGIAGVLHYTPVYRTWTGIFALITLFRLIVDIFHWDYYVLFSFVMIIMLIFLIRLFYDADYEPHWKLYVVTHSSILVFFLIVVYNAIFNPLGFFNSNFLLYFTSVMNFFFIIVFVKLFLDEKNKTSLSIKFAYEKIVPVEMRMSELDFSVFRYFFYTSYLTKDDYMNELIRRYIKKKNREEEINNVLR